MPVEGGAPRQLFAHDGDCSRPVVLIDGRVVFAATGPRTRDSSGRRETSALYVGDTETGAVDRTTWGAGPCYDPVVLPDGRIGFSALRRTGPASLPEGRSALYAMNWEGTNFTGLHGVAAEAPRMVSRPTMLDDGVLAYLGAPQAGETGALYVTSFYDPYPPPRRVIPTGEATDLAVQSVTDLGGGLLLASIRATGDEGFGLDLVDLTTGARAALLRPPAGHDLVDVVALRERPGFLGRFSRVDDSLDYGWIYCQDARRGRPERSRGDALRPVAVRVIEGTPLPAPPPIRPTADPSAVHEVGGSPPVMAQRLLGEVPLAEDGSFFLKVPADRPLRLQIVDENGVAVAQERGWQWVRPNQARGCVGCHADPQWAPRNQRLLATTRPPVDLTTGETARSVDFLHDVAPRLHRTCGVTSCHAGSSPAAGRSWVAEAPSAWCRRVEGGELFRCPPAYGGLMAVRDGVPPARGGRLIHPEDARSSPVVWMQIGRRLGEQVRGAPFERPLGRRHPEGITEELRRLVALWIDLGAPLDKTEIRRGTD